MSSGGKSRVPLGGLTSIFWRSSETGDGERDRAPDLPPFWLDAEERAQRLLGFSKYSLGTVNLRGKREELDKNRGFMQKLSDEWIAGIAVVWVRRERFMHNWVKRLEFHWAETMGHGSIRKIDAAWLQNGPNLNPLLYHNSKERNTFFFFDILIYYDQNSLLIFTIRS